MRRIWEIKKLANERLVRDYAGRSPVMQCLGSMDFGEEWRTIVAFNTKTLVRDKDGTVRRAGPVVLGIRYHERFLSEAPDPMEVVSVLQPSSIYHPNGSASGALCIGHPAPGIPLDLILHQVWAGLMFNMKIVNTRPGQIVNPEAAIYVRSNAHLFPISTRGMFEQPDDELRNGDWHISFDPQRHSAGAQPFVVSEGGA
jgi:hypothetical protein